MTAASRLLLPICALALLLGPGLAQSPPASPPAAGTITQAPPAGPAPATPTPGGPAAPPPAAPDAWAGLPTLVPESGDPVNVDEVELPAKPVLVASGSGSWDDGLKTLRGAFIKVQGELNRLGLKAAGKPIAVFTQTSDDNFSFDAMIPIAAAPPSGTAAPAEMRFGVTPSGKAYRFVHKGAYDEIDTTYETITAYLDAKDITAKDSFIEEYVNDVSDPADTALEVNIFVQPK